MFPIPDRCFAGVVAVSCKRRKYRRIISRQQGVSDENRLFIYFLGFRGTLIAEVTAYPSCWKLK